MNEKKTVKRRFSAHKKGVILFKRAMTILFLISLSLGIVYSENQFLRTVNIKVAADGGFKNNKLWKQDMERLITNSSQIFENNFGIRFKIKEFEYWHQEYSNCSMVELLNGLRKKVAHGNCDIVLGLVHKWPSKCTFSGMANYLNGYILLKKTSSKSLLKLMLRHELCHIFGAIDLNERGSIMCNKNPGFEFDKFTAQIILLNKYRSFNPHAFPLPKIKLDEAITIYKQRKKLKHKESDLSVFLSCLYIENKDYDSAIEECNQALQLNPDSIEIHNFLGISLQRRGKIEQAISEYEKALNLQPFLPEVHYNLGIAYEKKGMNGDAGREYQKAIRLNPQYAKAYANLGNVYFKKGLLDQSIEKCQMALKIYPELAEALCTMGASLFLKKNFQKAEMVFLKALKKNPDLSMAHNNLAGIYCVKGHLEEAIQEYKKAIEINPYYANAYSNLGYAYIKKGLMKDAEIACSKAIALNPTLPEVYNHLAKIFFSQKKYNLSWDYLRKAETLGIRSSPDFNREVFVIPAKNMRDNNI